MKIHIALQLLPFLTLLGCSGAQPSSVTMKTGSTEAGLSQKSSNDASKGSKAENSSSAPAGSTPSQNQPGGNSNNSTPGGGSGAASYTFAEAKAFCVGCHSATGPNAAQWGKADGDEAVWKAEVLIIRGAVNSGRMPRGASNFDKAKFIAFLDKLTSGGSSGGSMMPAALTFDTAKVVCTSCHGPNSNNRDARQEYPMSDSNVADWRSKKNKIISEVEGNSMPPGGISDAALKKAFLDYVRAL